MIREIKTGMRQADAPRKTKDRKRRRARLNRWTVAKYDALTVTGVLLFRAGAAYAYDQRGYFAVGGEVFALFLPAIYYIISVIVRDLLEDIKQEFPKDGKEKAAEG